MFTYLYIYMFIVYINNRLPVHFHAHTSAINNAASPQSPHRRSPPCFVFHFLHVIVLAFIVVSNRCVLVHVNTKIFSSENLSTGHITYISNFIPVFVRNKNFFSQNLKSYFNHNMVIKKKNNCHHRAARG